jgi:hypothetical protein
MEAYGSNEAGLEACVEEPLRRLEDDFPRGEPSRPGSHRQSNCKCGVLLTLLSALSASLDEKTAWTLTKPSCCTYRYVQQAPPDRRLQEVLG